jgi:hypothetical protein
MFVFVIAVERAEGVNGCSLEGAISENLETMAMVWMCVAVDDLAGKASLNESLNVFSYVRPVMSV